MLGIDFAYNAYQFDIANVLADDIKFICRYYSPETAKNLTTTEVQLYTKNKLGIISVFEDGTSNAYGGASQATIDAQVALKCAHAVNQPKGTPIFFSVDVNNSFTQINNILEYFKTVKNILSDYTIGVYGSYATAQYLKENAIVDYTWCVESWKENFTGNWQPDIVQLVNNVPVLNGLGISVDVDTTDNLNVFWNLNRSKKMINQTIAGMTASIIVVKGGMTATLVSSNNGASCTVWVLNNAGGNRSVQFTDMILGKPYTIDIQPNETALSIENTNWIPIGVLVE